MFKKICLAFLFIPFFSLGAETKNASKTEGYKYTVDNYFSNRPSSRSYSDSSRIFVLSGGASFYRESAKQSFGPLSSFVLGFNQVLREIKDFGDISLQVSVFSSKMAKQNSALLEIASRLSMPPARLAFPLYVGLGAGLGFYPYYIVKKIPSLSVSAQFFAGFRFFDLYHNLGLSAELNLQMRCPFNEMEIYIETFGQGGLIFSF